MGCVRMVWHSMGDAKKMIRVDGQLEEWEENGR